MYTKTTATTSSDLTDDSIILNQQESSGDNIRFQNCLAEGYCHSPVFDYIYNSKCCDLLTVRKLAAQSKNPATVARSKWKVAIVSDNNFPTKAGLASSASGYACLGWSFLRLSFSNLCLTIPTVFPCIVYTLAQLYELDSSGTELSALARRGSGSACRSLFGGFVRWYHDSQPCVARPLAGWDHWPELRCLVAVASNRTKTVGSTEGMRRSAETSQLLQHRVRHIVPQRADELQQAIMDKNFALFAQLTMKDSNQFHAICLDTYPPLFYLDGTSRAIIQLVHHYNKLRGETKV